MPLAALVALVGGAVGWVYAHPPLTSYGYGTHHVPENSDLVYRYSIDLKNEGRWPLRLTGVITDGRAAEYPMVMAATNRTDNQLASSAAVMLDEYGHKLEIGPVEGWLIEPHGQGGPPPATYGIRLDWGKTTPPAEVVLHYRYLGLPMRYVFTDRWGLK